MAGGSTFTLFVVCLWLFGAVNSQTFTATYSNTLAGVGTQGHISVSLDTYVAPTTLSVSATPASLTFTPPTLNIAVAGVYGINFNAAKAGVYSISFTSSTVGYTIPATGTVTVFVNAKINSPVSLYPGTTVQDQVVLDASAVAGLTATISSVPGVTLNPSVFNFVPGQALSQVFTVTSRQPGSYTINLVLSGPDVVSGVAGPNSNVTLTVDPRLVYGRSSTSLTALHVGDVSGPILIYLDVAPDNDLSVTVTSSTTDVTISPTTLQFTPTVLSGTFTVSGAANTNAFLSYQIGGTDASKYALAAPPSSVTVSNRTVSVGNIPPLVVGIPSAPVTVYVQEVPPTPLTLTFSGSGLTFTPPSVTFDSSTAVALFTVTASASLTTAGTAYYTISGTNAGWYTPLPQQTVNIQTALRTVQPTFTLNLNSFPVDTPVQGTLTLNVPTPTSFSVSLSGTGLTFTPSTLTFSSTTSSATQKFEVVASTLGSSRIIFTTSGTDASLVSAISAVDITVVPRTAPTLNFPTPIWAGQDTEGFVSLPSAVTSSLTITLTANPPSAAVLTPASITLPAGSTNFYFTVSASSITPFQLSAALSGTDAAYYNTVATLSINVQPISVVVSGTLSSLVVGVPASGLTLSLSQPTSLIVLVTPSSTAFQFSPSSFTLGGDVTSVCITVTPLEVAPASSIQFVLNDTLNFVPPNVVATSAVNKRQINQLVAGPLSLTVGVPSQQLPFTLTVPPTTSLVLTPSGSGLTFTPSSLSFTPSAASLFFTITATSTDLSSTTVTWSVSGTDAADYTVPNTLTVNINKRLISVPSTIASATVGTPSQPVLITTNYAPPTGLTITPAAPGLTFSPASVQLGPGAGFGAFTAELPAWSDAAANPYDIQYGISGPDADWYQLSTTQSSFSVSKRTITVSAPSSLTYGIPSTFYTVTLSNPPPGTLALTLCGPAGLTTVPSPISFGPGEVQAQYYLTDDTAGSAASVTPSWDLSGTSADLYTPPNGFSLALNPNNAIGTSFPGSLTVGTSAIAEFWLHVGFDLPDLSVTLTPLSNQLTFTPASITFTSTNLHFYVEVSANNLIQLTGSVHDTVTFVLSGPDAYFFAAPVPSSVAITFKTITVSYPSLAYVGQTVPGSVSLSLPPASSVTLTAHPSQNLTFAPSSFTFTPSVTVAYFTVTPSAAFADAWVEWELSGPEATYYTVPAEHDFLPAIYGQVTALETIVALSPDSPASSRIHLTLDLPPTNGLTVTPVTPPGLSASPATLTFGPGEVAQSFVVQGDPNAYSLRTGSYTIDFAISGADSQWYTSEDAVNVAITLDFFTISPFSAVVGVPQTIKIQTNVIPPHGVTLTPSAIGVTFDPEQILFSGTSVAYVTITATSVADNIPISWTVSGQDAWFYQSIGTTTFTSSSRNFQLVINGDVPSSFVAGVPYEITATVDYPPPSGLTVTLASPCIDFPTFSFSPTNATLQGLFTPISLCGDIDILFSGPDAAWYTIAGSLATSLPVSPRSVYFDGSFAVVSGQPSSQILVTLQVPGDITITPFASGCVFTPTSLAFSDSIASLPFTFSCATTAVTIDVSYIVTGDDADLYDDPDSDQISISANLIYIPEGPIIIISGQPSTVQISIAYPPATPVTLVPSSSAFTFDPPVITFTKNEIYALLTVTSTTPFLFPYPPYPLVPQTTELSYTISGTDIGGVGLQSLTTEFNVLPGTINFPDFDEIDVGATSDEITLYADPAPVHGVTVTPTAPGCTFTPATAAFTPTNPTAVLTYSCSSPGTVYVQFELSGTDAVHYTLPVPTPLQVNSRIIESFMDTTVTVFQQGYGYVDLLVPTEKGLTITPSAAQITFTPSSLVIPPGGLRFSFYFVPTELSPSNTPVSFVLSGPDANLYAPPYQQFVFVGQKQVQVVSDYTAWDSTPLLVGTPTNVYVISLDYPPVKDLIVTPYGAGLTFSPPSLKFTPGVSGLPFTISASVDGADLPIYYELSGDDAPYYYVTPSTSTITTELLTIDLSYNDEPTVGTPSEPAVISATNTPLADVTLTFSGANVTFSTPSVTFGPYSDSAVFQLTPLVVGQGSISVSVSGPGASNFASSLFTWTYDAQARVFRTPGSFPDLFAGVTSSIFSVGLELAPPTSVVLTPSAPNVVFSPSSLSFSPSTHHVEFNVTSVFPAEQNPLVNSAGFHHVVTWQLSGPDAAWYIAPDTFNFYAVPRDLQVITPFLTTALVNVPILLSIVTTYAPATNLTIIPRGPFLFEPSTITLSPGVLSSTLSVTPQATGSFEITFLLAGPDAPLYTALPDVNFIVEKWSFEIPSFSAAFEYGLWNAPLTFRTAVPPPNNVTLTLTSNYLDFFPSPTLSFSSSSPFAEVSLRLKGLAYKRSSHFTVSFWVGGNDAALFSTPSPVTFTWNVAQPLRDLAINGQPSELVVGVPSTPITVSVPTPPIGTLVLTPYATIPNVVFTPSSVTLTPTSPLTTSFSFVVNSPSDLTVFIALNGTDAVYYSSGNGFSVTVDTRSFNIPSSIELLVGQDSQPFAVSLEYPTPTQVDLYLSAPGITFTPSHLTFLPDQTTVSVVASGGSASSSVPVSVWIAGPDASWYDVPAALSLDVNSRGWTNTPGDYSLVPGESATVYYTVDVPPNDYITITPSAAGVTFTPSSLNITSAESSGAFTLEATAAGVSSVVHTTVSGPDALFYGPVDDYNVDVGYATVTIVSLDNEVQLGSTNAIVFALSAPAIDGLYLTPIAQGLTFDPVSVYFPPGVQFAHATYTATFPGQSQITYTVSGDDASLFNIDTSNSQALTIYNLRFDVAAPSTLADGIIVGSLSPVIALSSVGNGGGNPLLPPPKTVTVDIVVSPPGAVDIVPSSFNLTATSSAAHFQVRPNILSDAIVVQLILSGDGAVYYDTPDPFVFSSIPRDFVVSDFTDWLVDPANQQFVVGVSSGPFGITARSVPSDVALYLSAPGLEFIPSVLRFTGTYETLYFTVVPTQVIQTYTTFSVGGTDANLFNVPDVSPLIRVTHNFIIPELPPVVVGRTSDVLTVTIASTITSAVVLEPTANCAVFSPPYLLFTPNVSSQSFTYTGICVNNNLGDNVNPLVISSELDYSYANPPTYSGVTWNVRELGEHDSYVLSQNQLQGTQALTVVPATFRVKFPSISIGSTGTVTIDVTAAPRSDVVLTLVANNLNFEPPFVSFSSSTTLPQNITVRAVHSDFKDSTNIPFKVDYIVSGSNWRDFIPPAQTFLGVQQGGAPLVGGIQGSAASSIAASWLALVVLLFAVLM